MQKLNDLLEVKKTNVYHSLVFVNLDGNFQNSKQDVLLWFLLVFFLIFRRRICPKKYVIENAVLKIVLKRAFAVILRNIVLPPQNTHFWKAALNDREIAI